MDPWVAVPGLRSPRRLVTESWDRARRRRLDPERVVAPLPVDDADLDGLRAAHPLAAALPVVRSLLVDDAEPGSGVIVAVGDAAGRLLWVEGDPDLRRRAESMRFLPGADWSERAVGTSAPGTALALDHGLQIAGHEHFALPVQAWSCTAVPVHDLETHEILGVIDITGGDAAVGAAVLPLLTATVAAVERELLLQRLAAGHRPRRAAVARAPRLAVLGRDAAVLTTAAGATTLSLRHAELLTLLAWHRQGLSAERLAELVHGRADAVGTIRPEMVRLRRLLATVAPVLAPLARPYRLPVPIEVDARIVLGLLDRGARRAALDAAIGPVLPDSIAPGIETIRHEVASRLRESILQDAGAELLLAYLDGPGADDEEVLRAALRQLPRRSPRRAGVVARLTTISG